MPMPTTDRGSRRGRAQSSLCPHASLDGHHVEGSAPSPSSAASGPGAGQVTQVVVLHPWFEWE